MKQISRQREWQKRQQKKGLCIICGRKAVNALHCEKHRLVHRIICRNRYRLKNGIPLQAPLSKVGRPRQEKETT